MEKYVCEIKNKDTTLKCVRVKTTFDVDDDKKLKSEIQGDDYWADICATSLMEKEKEKKDDNR